jgi:hypothetical protein
MNRKARSTSLAALKSCSVMAALTVGGVEEGEADEDGQDGEGHQHEALEDPILVLEVHEDQDHQGGLAVATAMATTTFQKPRFTPAPRR